MNPSLKFDLPKLTPVKTGIWKLSFDWTVVFRGECYHIPAGVLTDGASIPRWLWWLCGTPMAMPRLLAALMHDYLYAGGDPEATRADADGLYRDLQIALGVPRWKAYIEWLMLRLFGASHFIHVEQAETPDPKDFPFC